jgi:hypothetical protein
VLGRQAGGILHAGNLLNVKYQMDDGRDPNPGRWSKPGLVTFVLLVVMIK